MVCSINIIDCAFPLHFTLVKKHNPIGSPTNGAVLMRHHDIGATATGDRLQLSYQIFNHGRGDRIKSGAVILFDDAREPGQPEVLERWTAERGVSVELRESEEVSFALVTCH